MQFAAISGMPTATTALPTKKTEIPRPTETKLTTVTPHDRGTKEEESAADRPTDDLYDNVACTD